MAVILRPDLDQQMVHGANQAFARYVMDRFIVVGRDQLQGRRAVAIVVDVEEISCQEITMAITSLKPSFSEVELGRLSAGRQSNEKNLAVTESVMPSRNGLLRAMSGPDRRALAPGLTLVDLASGEKIYEPEYPVDWIWFPITAVLSVVTVMHDGREVESETIGRESAVGILAAVSHAVCTSRTFTQVPGQAFRLSAERLRRQVAESPQLHKLLMRHALANHAQTHQTAACNALHDVGARACRWLLMSQDRTASNVVRLTQQYLATMVGVQRTTVTELLADLAQAGIIAKSRGSIEILDRDKLEARACECYETVQSNLERLIGEAPVAP